MVVEVRDVEVARAVYRGAAGIGLLGEGQRRRRVRPRRQLPHPGVALTGDVEIAGGVDRYTVGVAEVCQWQICCAAGPRRELHHLVVVGVSDIDGAGTVHCQTGTLVAKTVDGQRSWCT